MSLPLIDSAFADHLATLILIELSGVGIAFMILLMIGALAFYKMQQHPDSGRTLKFMFLLSFLSATSWLICSIVGATLALTSDSNKLLSVQTAFIKISYVSHPSIPFVVYSQIVLLNLFTTTLLATLVLRLHVTFRETVYKMTANTVRLFVVIFIILFVSGLSWLIALILMFNDHENIDSIFGLLDVGSFFIVYNLGSFLAVRFFVNNLNKLAVSRVNSQRDVTRTPSADAIQLNKHQQKLLNLSAKYILLFVVSILSTILSTVLVLFVSTEMADLFVSIDLCINLFCLYLQFAFAAGHYKKCCFRLDSRCRKTVSNRVKRAIHRNALCPPPSTAVDSEQTHIEE